MTTPGEDLAEQDEESSENLENLLYHVSFPRLDQLKRSAMLLVAERRVPTCPSYNTPAHELTDPQKVINEIADHYEDSDGFIQVEMPLKEIVFRTLLTRKNQATSLLDLHYELTERWSTPVRPITVTPEGLRRILDTDVYYGFEQV